MKFVFCLPGKTYSKEFLLSWTSLVNWLNKNGHDYVISQNYSSVVHFARAKCLGANVLLGEDQKPFNGELEYDYIMWIDSDIVFSPKEFQKILESPYDITTGLYRMENLTNYAVVKDWDENYFLENGTFEFLSIDKLQKYKQDVEPRYMKVVYSGMGWMLIKKGVIEQLKYPWFNHDLIQLIKQNKIDDDKDDQINKISEEIIIKDMMSEDVAFCKNLEKIGIDIYVDTEIIVGHQKYLII